MGCFRHKNFYVIKLAVQVDRTIAGERFELKWHRDKLFDKNTSDALIMNC